MTAADKLQAVQEALDSLHGYARHSTGARHVIDTVQAALDGPTLTPAAPVPAGGPWTRHGHIIPGVTVAGSGRPPVARCGGPRICAQCAIDAQEARA